MLTTLAGILVSCALALQMVEPRIQGAIRVRTVGSLPFSFDELKSTVSARLPLTKESSARTVIVGPAGPAGVALSLEDRRAVVNIGERTSVAAARVVALAIADLAGEPAPAPLPVEVSVTGSQDDARAPGTRPAATRAGDSDLLTAAVEVSRGFASEEAVTYGVLVDVTRRRGWFAYGGGLGAWVVPAQHAGKADEASLTAGVARLWCGAARGGFEVLAGPFAAPYHLGGVFDRNNVLAGGGLALRARRGLGRTTQVSAVLRVDGFANRVRTSVGTVSPSFATPRVAVALGLGLTFDLGGP